MVKFKEFQVSICVNGKSLAEYATENDNGSTNDTITRYVEAESGAEFQLHMECLQSQLPGPSLLKCVNYAVYMDGHHMASRYADQPKFKGEVSYRHEYHNNDTYTRAFKFSDIQIVEEAPPTDALSFQNLRAKLQETGTVTVLILRAYGAKSVSRGPADGMRHEGLSATTKVPEKALKGDTKSHFVELGGSKLVKPVTRFYQPDYYDTYTNPYARFVFKYRSRKSLESLQIMKPLEERNASDLDRNELLQLVNRLKQGRADPGNVVKPEAGLKRERGVVDMTAADSPRRVRARPGTQVEIVDLTDD